MKTAVAIRHVFFEDLGILGRVLEEARYRIHYIDMDRDNLAMVDPLTPDLLIVLGAPVGVYQSDIYPFLARERELLKRRVAAGLPTMGICLGAQQLAASLGAEVKPSGGHEIGFAPVALTEAGEKSSLHHLSKVSVLHWHGDVLDLPPGALRLAYTEKCPTQAFSIGANILGLQFHPEVETERIESWLVGHASELASVGVSPNQLRADALAHQENLQKAAFAMFREWVANLT